MRKRETTVERIANMLVAEDSFIGFEETIEKAILGDLLLCYCIDNVKNSLGRQGAGAARRTRPLSGKLGRSSRSRVAFAFCPRNDSSYVGR